MIARITSTHNNFFTICITIKLLPTNQKHAALLISQPIQLRSHDFCPQRAFLLLLLLRILLCYIRRPFSRVGRFPETQCPTSCPLPTVPKNLPKWRAGFHRIFGAYLPPKRALGSSRKPFTTIQGIIRMHPVAGKHV